MIQVLELLTVHAIYHSYCSAIKLHQELANPSNIHNFGSVDRLMMGLAFEKSQSRDVFMTEELTRRLFQTPGSYSGKALRIG